MAGLLEWHGIVLPPSGAGGPDGTTRYVEITIDNTQIDATLTDYPIMIRLDDLPAAYWTNGQSDGGDLRATEDDGSTQLPLELVWIDSANDAGEIHVKVSSVSSSADTVIRIWYDGGGGLTQPAITATYGAENVWTEYEGVWHLHNTSWLDSTANDHDLTASNMSVTSDQGPYGTGWDVAEFENASSIPDLKIASASLGALDITGDHTLSAFIRAESSGVRSMIRESGSGTTTRQWEFRLDIPNTRFEHIYSDGSSDTTGRVTDALVAINAWAYYWSAVDISAKTFDMSINGIAKTDSVTGTATTIQDLTRDFQIGGSWTASFSFDGRMEEARVATDIKAAAWGKAEGVNWKTPLTFYSVSAELP